MSNMKRFLVVLGRMRTECCQLAIAAKDRAEAVDKAYEKVRKLRAGRNYRLKSITPWEELDLANGTMSYTVMSVAETEGKEQ